MELSILTSNKNKKAQVWSLDLVIASFIFLTGIIILFVYSINYLNQADRTIQSMTYEGNSALNFILSDDGILVDKKINQTKFDSFYALSYGDQKKELALTDDFYFVLSGLESNGSPIEYVGKLNNTPIKNKIKITRLAVYKNKISDFDFYVWE